MRSRLLGTTGLAAALALAVPAGGSTPAGAATGKRCAHLARDAVVLKRTVRVLAFRERKRFGARTYACYRPTGRTMLLHTSSSGVATTDIVLDGLAVFGRVVAYHVQARGDSNYSYVRSFDVRSGKRLRRSGKFLDAPVTDPYPQPPAVIATNARGAIVWLANSVLRALDSRGSRVLAIAFEGAITHVRAGEVKASWIQNGHLRRARLT